MTRCTTFAELAAQRVALEHLLLKPNMVLAGRDSAVQPSVQESATATLRCVRAVVPPAVPGIAFLSGGQGPELATTRLGAMNAAGPQPRVLTFSYSRAVEDPVLAAWRGEPADVPAAQLPSRTVPDATASPGRADINRRRPVERTTDAHGARRTPQPRRGAMTRQPGEARTTRGSDEREPRSLTGPALQFELSVESARLRAEREYIEGDRNARTLTKVDWFRLVLVALRSGARLDEADQHGSIALQVLEGRVTVQVGDETIDVGEREVSVIAPGYPWTAVAVDDSLVLLHLAWPPAPGSSVTA